MNQNAEKWAKALRSGEYEQGVGQLRFGDTFCCLGVACDLYRKETGDGEWLPKESSPTSVFAVGHTVAGGTLPERVRIWLGLRRSAGDWSADSNLSSMNDEGGTFDEIADVIEKGPDDMYE